MNKHTPEPWIIWNGGDGILMHGAKDPKRGGVALMCCNELVSGRVSIANARRIVACVNALQGITTEELERHHLSHAGEVQFRIEITKQRDALMAALKRIAAYPETRQQELSIEAVRAIARVAVEKAEGDDK